MPLTRSRVTGGVGLASARHHFKVLISVEEVWRSTRRRSKLATNAENAFATRKHLNVSIISKETVQISVSRPLKWGLFKARAASSYVRVLGNASLQPTLTGKDMKASSPSISVPVVHLHFNAPGTEDKIEGKSHFKAGVQRASERNRHPPDGKQLLRILSRLQWASLSLGRHANYSIDLCHCIL